MKTVTAISANGLQKIQVPIVAENGYFSVAHPVDLRNGQRKVFGRLWSVYHTKTGAAFVPAFSKKSSAIKAMDLIAKVKGNWDRPLNELAKDRRLEKRFHEILFKVKVECGDWIKIS